MNYGLLIQSIHTAHQQSQAGAAGAVNQHLIFRNWLIGAHMIEFEQSDEDRAKYGERLQARIASDLKTRNIRGLGASMLRDCRAFSACIPKFANRWLVNSLSPSSKCAPPSPSPH